MRLSRVVSRLALEYFAADHLGYGRMGLQIHRALERAGIDVTTDSLDGSAETALYIKIPPLCKRWLESQQRIIWTMYETTEVPTEFRDLHEFDMVVVPCEANREAFSRWHHDVVTVPLAVDERWKYRKPVVDGPFTVLASGSEFRKGLDLACDVFRKAFPNNNDVRLLLKAPTQMTFGLPVDPRFQMVSGFLTADEEVALYASANVYLGMSRGEGFGMMPLQAIVQGTPTIMSAGHGHAMFEQFGISVDTNLVPAVEYKLYGEAGDWWLPSVDDAVDKLRYVYDNYTHHVAAAKKNALKAAKTFTWDASAKLLLSHLGLLRLYQGSGKVCFPEPRDVWVVAKVDVHADIGPYRVDIVQGDGRWVPPDVKRVLRDADAITDDSWHDWRQREVNS